MNWSHATAVILTCDRDKELMALCRRGIELFWPGMNVAVLHDTDTEHETSLPDDVREAARRVPYLRKVFDLPWIAPTDQIYCLDSDCMLVDEPTDWAPAAHLAVAPGSMGSIWLEQGAAVWTAIGGASIATDVIFCGGCWSADRREMFEPHRDLAIAYVRECLRRGYDKVEHPGVVLEQCLLNGLWHKAYGRRDCHLRPARYPLYQPNPQMALLHLSDTARGPDGQQFIDRYKQILRMKEEELGTPDDDDCGPLPQPRPLFA